MEINEALVSKIREVINSKDLSAYFGTYQGETFLVVESWNEVRTIEAAIGCELYEALDYNYGFSDEYNMCDRCGNIVKTSPDSYAWTPNYAILYDCELVCNDCLEFDEYIEYIANDYKKANTIFSEAELFEHDFVRLNDDDYEAGWYDRNDDPKKVFDMFSEKYEEIIFSITNQEQFRTEFAVYGRGPIENELEEEDEDII